MNKRKTGNEKEKLVAGYLEKEGYRIIETNFYFKGGEIDIIARDGSYLVFVEVKYRSGRGSGLPEESVTAGKIRRISRGALYYLTKYRYKADTPVRFDVAALDGNEIRLYKNAFSYAG